MFHLCNASPGRVGLGHLLAEASLGAFSWARTDKVANDGQAANLSSSILITLGADTTLFRALLSERNPLWYLEYEGGAGAAPHLERPAPQEPCLAKASGSKPLGRNKTLSSHP